MIQRTKVILLKHYIYYINYDGSIQAVADATFTHRNTINYRMKKIRRILKLDISSMKEKSDLYTAFLIRDFLAL